MMYLSALTLILLLSITAQSQTVLTMDCLVIKEGVRANELHARCKAQDPNFCTKERQAREPGNDWLCVNEMMIMPVSDGRLRVSTHPDGSKFTARWDETGIHFLTVTNIPVTEWHEKLRGKHYPWAETLKW